MNMFQRKDPSQLQKALEDLNSKQGFENNSEGEWKLTQVNGVGQARIRFLPAKDASSNAFVKMFNHGFQKNGKWFIESCPTTLGQECPVCKANSELWNSGMESDKVIVRDRKRKLSYYANIMVIADPANTENNGKVFKFRFGQKVMEKIQAMIAVNTEMGEVPVDVTCVFGGADFALKTKKVSGFVNYDESKFYPQSEIVGIETPEVQKHLMDGMKDLGEIVAPDKFKSFDEIKKRFDSIVNGAAPAATTAADQFDQQLAAFEAQAAPAPQYAPAPAQPAAPVQTTKTVVDDVPFDVDGDLSDLDSLLADL